MNWNTVEKYVGSDLCQLFTWIVMTALGMCLFLSALDALPLIGGFIGSQ